MRGGKSPPVINTKARSATFSAFVAAHDGRIIVELVVELAKQLPDSLHALRLDKHVRVVHRLEDEALRLVPLQNELLDRREKREDFSSLSSFLLSVPRSTPACSPWPRDRM